MIPCLMSFTIWMGINNVIDSYKCTANNPNCYAIKDNPDRTYGLPKGTLVSQWVGVKLLDDLDRALSELRGAIFEIRYADDCLYMITENDTKIVARNGDEYAGKKYWGDSHAVVINDFYNGRNYPTLEDAKNSMTALFKFYESAKNNGKEIFL